MTAPCIMLRTACGCVQYMVGSVFNLEPEIRVPLPARRGAWQEKDIAVCGFSPVPVRVFEYAETLHPKDGPEIRVYEEVL